MLTPSFYYLAAIIDSILSNVERAYSEVMIFVTRIGIVGLMSLCLDLYL